LALAEPHVPSAPPGGAARRLGRARRAAGRAAGGDRRLDGGALTPPLPSPPSPMRLFTPLALALAGLLAGPAFAQTPTQTLSGVITSDRVLDASQVYLLDGEVYVDDGVTLTIPAGTVLKGRQTPSAGNGVASVLVVQRGARLV